MPGGGGGGGGGGSGNVESAEARAHYKFLTETGRQTFDAFKKTALPMYFDLGRMIQQENTPGRISQAEGLASADVAQAYNQQESSLRNMLGRYGIRPGSGKWISGMRNLGLGMAADTAGARTAARIGVLDRRKRDYQNYIQLGNPLLGQTSAIGQGAQGLASIGASKRNARSQEMAGWGQLAGSLGSAAIMTLPFLGSGGATLPFLGSDRRLKTDIKAIGEIPGLTVYEYRFIDDPDTVYTGLMADEVEVLHPEHVREFGGYKMVNYYGVLTDVLEAA